MADMIPVIIRVANSKVGHNYADATGHVGIVIGEKMTASASALVKGQIVQNDWGFRTDSKPTFRRFKG